VLVFLFINEYVFVDNISVDEKNINWKKIKWFVDNILVDEKNINWKKINWFVEEILLRKKKSTKKNQQLC